MGHKKFWIKVENDGETDQGLACTPITWKIKTHQGTFK